MTFRIEFSLIDIAKKKQIEEAKELSEQRKVDKPIGQGISSKTVGSGTSDVRGDSGLHIAIVKG